MDYYLYDWRIYVSGIFSWWPIMHYKLWAVKGLRTVSIFWPRPQIIFFGKKVGKEIHSDSSIICYWANSHSPLVLGLLSLVWSTGCLRVSYHTQDLHRKIMAAWFFFLSVLLDMMLAWMNCTSFVLALFHEHCFITPQLSGDVKSSSWNFDYCFYFLNFFKFWLL